MAFFEDLPVGKLTVTGGGSIGTLPTVTGLTVSHKQVGPLVHSTFTLAGVPQTVVNGTEYQGTKLFTFPEGRISVLGVTATLAQTTTSALASTLNASSTGAVALGSVTASNVSLTSTMVDFAPSTAFTSSATINVAGTAVKPVLAAPAHFDGSSTPIAFFLNSAFATTTDVDADATQTWAGTIAVTWILVGDF